MPAVFNVGQLKQAIKDLPDDRPVQVLLQNLTPLTPPTVIYEQLVIQDLFQSPGWHGDTTILRIAVHHQNGVFNRPCGSPTTGIGPIDRDEPQVISENGSIVGVTPEELERLADGRVQVVEGNQHLCPHCGWANHLIRRLCRNCKRPLPETP